MPRRIALPAALVVCVLFVVGLLATGLLTTGALAAAPSAHAQLEKLRSVDLPEAERELAWRISEPRMVAAVRQLVAIGPRMGGTQSNETSAAWLAEQFEYAGLEVRVRDDAPQRFHEEDGWEVSVVGGDTLEAAWPQGGSPSADGTGRLSTTPGDGLVCLTSERPRPDATAGCLAVLSDGRAGASGWPQVGGLRGEWTIPVFGISTEEGEMLRALVAEEPTTEIRVKLVSRMGEARPKTVIATIPGQDRSRNLLFSAHGDSDAGGPGADDNASGAAVVLEIARVWAEAIRLGMLEAPPYDVRFAVWGAEISSTRDYVAELLENDQMPEAVINFDMPGYGTWREAIYFEPDEVPINRGLIVLLRAVANDHLGVAGFPERFASNSSQGGTDSYVFQREELVGEQVVPAVTLYASAWSRERVLDVTPGFPPVNWYEDEEEGKITIDGDAFYHTAGDSPENTTDTEPWNMGWNARIGWLAALRFMAEG
jgi:hypothetical protein